eukprot:GHVL01007689.1.p1 GENE.GHVL01007689.1~~GHVL01007689.1.p1  ORF type:complete len:302 (-),score=74.13 GHVL01007689.1:125-1030(-)
MMVKHFKLFIEFLSTGTQFEIKEYKRHEDSIELNSDGHDIPNFDINNSDKKLLHLKNRSRWNDLKNDIREGGVARLDDKNLEEYHQKTVKSIDDHYSDKHIIDREEQTDSLIGHVYSESQKNEHGTESQTENIAESQFGHKADTPFEQKSESQSEKKGDDSGIIYKSIVKESDDSTLKYEDAHSEVGGVTQESHRESQKKSKTFKNTESEAESKDAHSEVGRVTQESHRESQKKSKTFKNTESEAESDLSKQNSHINEHSNIEEIGHVSNEKNHKNNEVNENIYENNYIEEPIQLKVREYH